MDVTRAGELVLTGYSRRQLSRLVGRGELTRVRHGAYAGELGTDELARHRQLIAATWPTVEPGTVLSHTSAGVLHGLPSWTGTLARVTVVRRTAGHGSRRTSLHVRLAPLRPDEVVTIDGYLVTSLERTAADLARLNRYDRGVATLDAALHAMADRGVLFATIAEAKGRHGAGRARAALAFADGRAESVGESISRVRMVEAGLPIPELQVNLFDEFGNWVARTDAAWLDLGVVGEFDGKVKYSGGAEQAATAVMREKSREADIRALGWSVARWDWPDLANLDRFRRRILTGFEQADPARIRGYAEPLPFT